MGWLDPTTMTPLTAARRTCRSRGTSLAIVMDRSAITGDFVSRRSREDQGERSLTFRCSKGALNSDSSTAAAPRSASMSRRCERTTSTPHRRRIDDGGLGRRYPGEQVRANPARTNFREPAPHGAREGPGSTRSPSRACEWPCLRGCVGAGSPGDKSDRLRGVGQASISLAREGREPRDYFDFTHLLR
jgi:hypothetical protein